MYDGLLKLKLSRYVTPMAFADDIELVIVAKYLEGMNHLFSIAFASYHEWFELV